MIPKIIHRVWLGNSQIPIEYEQFWERWKLLHPSWEFRHWGNNEILALSLNPIIQKASSYVSKADIARYEIIFKYGGVYLDCDMDCYQPIDSLIQADDEFIVCNQITDFKCLCSIGFFASVPNHPILRNAINEIQQTSIQLINSSDIAETTGPYFFRRIINNRRVKILETCMFYPYFHLKSEWYKQDATKIFGVHTWGASWLPISSLSFLAQKQYKNGDLKSCAETFEKAMLLYNKNYNKKSKDFQKIKNTYFQSRFKKIYRKIIFIFFIKAFIILYFTLYNFSLKYSAQRYNFFSVLFNRSISLFSKVAKSFSLFTATLQYNHLLDSLFHQKSEHTSTNILEIGAMDGKSFDKLYPYIKISQNLNVIFVEPLAEKIEKLKENYSGYEQRKNNFYFECVAITESFSEKIPIYFIPEETIKAEALPEWVRGIATLVPDRNALDEEFNFRTSSGKTLNQLALERTIEGVPLSHVLENNPIKEFDILQIDTEGYDVSILRQSLNLIKPKLICFEWSNVDKDEKKMAISKLQRNGYTAFLSLDSYDCIACDKSTLLKFLFQVFIDHSIILLPPKL